VRFIKKAQAVGFTLAEIKEILELKSHARAPCRKVTELGEKHLRDIDPLTFARHLLLHEIARFLRRDLHGTMDLDGIERDCEHAKAYDHA
jgi:DNA-binding transcriptional MerR regulator